MGCFVSQQSQIIQISLGSFFTMTPQEEQRRTLSELGYQFLLGTALGLLFAMVPLAIAQPTLTLWNTVATLAIVLLFGLLSVTVGKKFLNALMQFLESLPPVA